MTSHEEEIAFLDNLLKEIGTASWNINPLLDFAASLAYQAGRITLGYFNTGIHPDFKADDTPVTVEPVPPSVISVERSKRPILTYSSWERSSGGLGGVWGQLSVGSLIQWMAPTLSCAASRLYAVVIGLEIEGVIRVGAAYFPRWTKCSARGGTGRLVERPPGACVRGVFLGPGCACYTTHHKFPPA